jgi:galactonate dehydratase
MSEPTTAAHGHSIPVLEARGPGIVKVTRVKTLVVNAELRNWVLVKVETDDPELYGWGEATLEWQTRAVVGAVEDLSPLLVGQNAMRIAHLWQSMYRHHFFKPGLVTMTAISGIDQALHDLAGKALGIPVYQLLGGAVRDVVRMYDHLGAGDAATVYGATPERAAEAARASIAEGLTALKILAVPMGAAMVSQPSISEAYKRMSLVREAVGFDIDIMVDLHGRTTPAMAIQYGRALSELKPWFFEEPCQPGSIQGMAEVARALPFPVATGERLVERSEFLDLMAAHACAVIQPDISHVGGFTAMRTIGALAELFQLAVAPHNPNGPIATAANLHFAFASPNHIIQEVMRGDVPWRDDVVRCDMPIVAGHIHLPACVGLGIEVDETAAARHPYKPEPQIAPLAPDGSVMDW